MQLLIQQAVLTDFRPVFILMLAISLLFFVLSVIPRGRNSKLNFLAVLIVSLVEIAVSGMLLVTESNLVEALDMTPDKITLYLFVAVLVFSIINPILFRRKNRGRQRYRYRG